MLKEISKGAAFAVGICIGVVAFLVFLNFLFGYTKILISDIEAKDVLAFLGVVIGPVVAAVVALMIWINTARGNVKIEVFKVELVELSNFFAIKNQCSRTIKDLLHYGQPVLDKSIKEMKDVQRLFNKIDSINFCYDFFDASDFEYLYDSLIYIVDRAAGLKSDEIEPLGLFLEKFEKSDKLFNELMKSKREGIKNNLFP